jgi:transposase
VLTRTLLPGAQLKVGPCFTFQQDNDPTHRAAPEIVQAYNKSHGTSITVLPWPPNSPDLNLIENAWAIVQRKVNAEACPTFEAFTAAVIQGLKGLDQLTINNLYSSMPNRLSSVVARHGGRTGY